MFGFAEVEGDGFAVAVDGDVAAAEGISVAGELEGLDEGDAFAEGDLSGAVDLATDADDVGSGFLFIAGKDFDFDGWGVVDAGVAVGGFGGGGDLFGVEAGDGEALVEEGEAEGAFLGDAVEAVDFGLFVGGDAAEGDLEGVAGFDSGAGGGEPCGADGGGEDELGEECIHGGWRMGNDLLCVKK